LYRHNELRARGVRWAGAAPKSKQGLLKRKARQADDGASPQPYYELAVPASAWIQYEAARSLKSFVGLMTTSPESFGHLALALASYREGKVDSARSGYEDALRDDPENVAALVNLSLLRARHHGEYDFAIEKLKQARAILKKRYVGTR
jgi:tetratricopeptide (TPR) repeat protein